MNHNLKMKLFELSKKNEFFSKFYHKAARVKTKHLQEMSDEEFLKRLFKENVGYELNLDNPQTFNEKLQWLKLHDRKPIYTIMADKYEAKKFVAERIGSEHIIPIVGGPWYDANDIQWRELPEQFVLKCNHDCGSVIICKDKNRFDFFDAVKKLNKALRNNYFYVGREWPYKNIKPCIFAEKYMVDESGYELKDYKFFCFDGVVKTIQVDFGRFSKHERNLYSPTWKYLGYTSNYPTNPNVQIQRPDNLDEMLSFAETLSEGVPHIRIDFYNVNGHCYFGEATFYHGGGTEKFDPPEWDSILGGWIELPKVDG